MIDNYTKAEMMEKLNDRQFEVLVKEYEILLALIREYDARLFQLKGWSTTVFSAAVGLALVNEKPYLLFVSLFSCVVFWGLEGLYKNFQFVSIERARDVEAMFNKSNGEKLPQNIGYLITSYYDLDGSVSSKIKRVLSKLFLFSVAALYFSKMLFLGIIYILVFYKWI